MSEQLTKLYLELHELLGATVLTPREKKFVDIITRQNAALESIAADVLIRSPQQVADLAKANTVVIAEKGLPPVSVAQYAARVAGAQPVPEPPPQPVPEPPPPGPGPEPTRGQVLASLATGQAAGDPFDIPSPPKPKLVQS